MRAATSTTTSWPPRWSCASTCGGGWAWGGAGVTFPRFDALQRSDVLPTWGVGLRFEFKHRVNLRVDYGFGRDTRGIVFQMSEAF